MAADATARNILACDCDVDPAFSMADVEPYSGNTDDGPHCCPDHGTPVDENAIDRFFRHMRAPLVAWFRRRVGDPVEAEDLCQESFLRIAHRQGAHRGETRLDDVDHLEGYLYRTAHSVLFDRRRRRSVRHADAHVPLLPEHDEVDGIDALRALLARETLQQVSAVLMTMPERTRSIFILCRLEGMRYAEIAARMNISVSAVQKHMLRAVETLLLHGSGEA